MFSCEYCGIFKINFEEHLWTAASIRCYFDKINLKQSGFCTIYSFKALVSNEKIKIISKIVHLKKKYFTILILYTMSMKCFTTKSSGFTKILKVNLYSVHAVRILDLSLEIMLSALKCVMKHLYNSTDFSFMHEQVYFYYLEECF